MTSSGPMQRPRVLNIRDLGRVGTWPKDVRRIDRRTPFGNPFRVDADYSPWLALALGQRADAAGWRVAAVMAYRAWITGTLLPVPSEDEAPAEGGDLEYADGSVRKVSDIPVAMGLFMLSKMGAIAVPERPNLEPLRGFRLACWCAPLPCHGDVIAELLDPVGVFLDRTGLPPLLPPEIEEALPRRPGRR